MADEHLITIFLHCSYIKYGQNCQQLQATQSVVLIWQLPKFASDDTPSITLT
jgi:hypothetical protein